MSKHELEPLSPDLQRLWEVERKGSPLSSARKQGMLERLELSVGLIAAGETGEAALPQSTESSAKRGGGGEPTVGEFVGKGPVQI